MLLESVDIITEYLHEELREFEEGEEIPPEHIAFHVRRLTQWRNLPQESATAQGHNGWTNYETWLTVLWLDNDFEAYDYWRNDASGVLMFTCEQEEPDAKRAEAAGHLARRLKEQIEPADVPLSGLYLDMLAAGFAAVNWYEIALGLIDAELQ